MNRLLPANMTSRAAKVFLTLGLIALILAAFAYGSEVVGSICGDGWISSSTGSGRCSGHDAVAEDIEINTFVGVEPVSWIEHTRWPLLLFGVFGTSSGLLALGASKLNSVTGLFSEQPNDHETFVNLHISVVAHGDRRTTTVTTADGSQVSAPFEFEGLTDRGAERLHELLQSRHKRRFGSNQTRAVEMLGNDLFSALFPPKLEAIYQQAFDGARQRDIGLRLVLEFDDATADLPWEYLHDKKRACFLALSSEASVIRRLPVSDETRPQDRVDTIRILVMGSSPVGSAPIDVASEHDRIANELAAPTANHQAEVRYVTGGTFDALRDHIDSFEPHVFHFVGHGAWDNDVDDGELVFETTSGGPHHVTGRELGVLLVRSGLRVVVLNSCEAARSSQSDRFAGIATSLVAQGVPSVLAMQFPIEDRAAATFGSTFLRHLVSSGSIDTSLHKARLAVYTTQRRVEWGTPVFTTRVPIERVLPVSADDHGRPRSAITTGLQA